MPNFGQPPPGTSPKGRPGAQISPVARRGKFATGRGDRFERSMDQQFSRRRGRVLKPAFLDFSDGRSIDCIVRSFSIQGAYLFVERPQSVPDRVWLRFQQDGPGWTARVIWRRQRSLGLRFNEKVDPGLGTGAVD